MSPPPLPPPAKSSEALPITGGFFATGLLHVIASVLVMAGGHSLEGSGGEMVVLFFWAGIGLAQWAYLLPAWLLTRVLGWRAFGKGLLAAGAVGTLLNAMCWGTFGLGTLIH